VQRLHSPLSKDLKSKQSWLKVRVNQRIICTGLSLAGQRESMYRVVLLRAQLVCDFAKTVEPSVKITVKERVIKAEKLNGRVEIISK